MAGMHISNILQEIELKNGNYLPQRHKGHKEIQMLMKIKTQTKLVKDFGKAND
jgi:hypothetical protein